MVVAHSPRFCSSSAWVMAMVGGGQQVSQQLNEAATQSASRIHTDGFFWPPTGSARQVPARQTAWSVLGSCTGRHAVALHGTTPQFLVPQSCSASS